MLRYIYEILLNLSLKSEKFCNKLQQIYESYLNAALSRNFRKITLFKNCVFFSYNKISQSFVMQIYRFLRISLIWRNVTTSIGIYRIERKYSKSTRSPQRM